MTQNSVFITGASTGIGLAAAQQLSAIGWQVFAGVLPSEDTSGLQNRPNITVIPIDITKGAMIQDAAEKIGKVVGENGLNGLINNAGIAVTGPLEFLPLDALRLQLEVNLIGHVAVTQAFMPLIRKATGRIVNTVSVLGRFTTPFSGPYCMSKFAMEAFTDTLRQEVEQWGIHVIAIEPGIIATPIWKKSVAATDEINEELPPQGRQLYGEALTAMREGSAQMEALGSPPEVVAMAMIEALTAKNPKTRYAVGKQAGQLVFLRWLLPDKMMDRLIKSRRR
jgi:NAD(P)-dependent dehydrogenase (short-subunit alcohol dehydrogenase family)